MQHNLKHNVTVTNRAIRVVGDPTIVKDNINVDRLTAKFDSEWDGLDGISVFFINGDTVIRQQYSDGMPIPWEVLTEVGTVLLTFKGYHGENEVIVTKQMKAGFIVEMSGISDGGEEPSESSPTEVQQIYSDIHGIREDIEAGMVKGDPGDPGYTPIKGVDYFDGEPGYTPQKGIDYFDGEPGYTPVKGVDYFDGAPGQPGQPGQDGSDYVITEDDYQEIAGIVKNGIMPIVDTKADKKLVERAERRIEILEAAATGKTHIWQLFNEDFSSTDVPAELTTKDGKGYADLVGIEGKTLVWNQLKSEGISGGATQQGINNSHSKENLISFSGTAEKSVGLMFGSGAASAAKVPYDLKGHKILVTAPYSVDYVSCYYKAERADSWTNAQLPRAKGPIIFTPQNTCNYVWPGGHFIEGNTYNESFRLMYFDLTAMFGAGNEPATVEEFRAMFPADYYPYNPGELVSMEVAKVESWGKNLFDKESIVYGYVSSQGLFRTVVYSKGANTTAVIKVNGEETYSIQKTVGGIGLLLAFSAEYPSDYCVLEGVYTDNNAFSLSVKAPASAKYLLVTVFRDKDYSDGYAREDVLNGFQVERGTTATPYSPYGTKDSLTVPTVNLRSAGNVRDRLDWMAGVVVRRVGVVDLGTLNWSKSTTVEGVFIASAPVMVASNNIVCAKFYTVDYKLSMADMPDMSIKTFSSASRLYVKDASTATMSAAEFKAAMQGILLYYELAEPTTEPIELPESWLTAEPNGSIRYKDADGEPVAVPHAVQFPINVNGGA